MPNALSTWNFPAVTIAQKSIAAASIGATYSIVGSSFSSPPVLIIIVSTLDEPVQFSWDGITDAFPIAARSNIIIDFKSDGLVLPAGAAPFVKEIGNPTSGSLYIGGFTV